jgi:hypothetical protein
MEAKDGCSEGSTGIAPRRLSFREIFTAVAGPLSRVYWILDFGSVQATMKPLWKAAWQQLMKEAPALPLPGALSLFTAPAYCYS